MADFSAHRVLLLHNRYRALGGEERCVEHLRELLADHGAEVRLLERRSDAISRPGAAAGMLRLGLDPAAVGRAAREFGATIVHAHNIHPAFGVRALEAARAAGAAVVLHLHNYRLYCAIGTVYRDGADCTLCAPGHPMQGVRHRCRGSIGESLAYASAIGRGRERTFAAVDRMIAPVAGLARDLTEELGRELPISVVPHWLPDAQFADRSSAGSGQYALIAGRVAKEKGIFTAIEAAGRSGVPLMVAGSGPDLEAARQYAASVDAPVEFAGLLGPEDLAAARMGAAFALLPSLWREVLPYSGLEAPAAGLPLITSDRGGLPDLTEPELVTTAGDARDLAAAMSALMSDAGARQAAGERALARARLKLSASAVAPELARVYGEAVAARKSAIRSPISAPASS